MKIGEGFSGNYADPDPFQQIWTNPAELEKALYVGDGVMVRLDDRPVSYGHVNVIVREQTPLEELPADKYLGMWAVARVTQEWLMRRLSPQRKAALVVWGNQVQTAHIHVVPRYDATDATQWQPILFTSETAREAHLTAARNKIAFPEFVRQAADAAWHDVQQMTRGLQLPPAEPAFPPELRGPGQQMQ